MGADWDTSGLHDRPDEQASAPPSRRFRKRSWFSSRRRRYGLITALVSVGIVGAFIWSGRDRGGPQPDAALPTIAADDAPVRVPPDNPGGMEFPHQDKLVYQRRPGEGEDLRMERLLPPPEEPLPPPASEPPAAAEPEQVMPPAREMLTGSASDSGEASPDLSADTATSTAADEPFPPPAAAPPPRPARAPAQEPPTAVRAEPAMPTTSPARGSAADAPRRLLPPSEGGPAVASSAPSRSSSATRSEVGTPTAAVASGGYMVQLLAVGSVDQAHAAWVRLKGNNADLLGGLSPSYVRADLGGRGVIYRLRAGPLSGETVARTLCAQLANRNVDCMIVSPSG